MVPQEKLWYGAWDVLYRAVRHEILTCSVMLVVCTSVNIPFQVILLVEVLYAL